MELYPSYLKSGFVEKNNVVVGSNLPKPGYEIPIPSPNFNSFVSCSSDTAPTSRYSNVSTESNLISPGASSVIAATDTVPIGFKKSMTSAGDDHCGFLKTEHQCSGLLEDIIQGFFPTSKNNSNPDTTPIMSVNEDSREFRSYESQHAVSDDFYSETNGFNYWMTGTLPFCAESYPEEFGSNGMMVIDSGFEFLRS